MAKKRGKQKQGLRAASLEREHETVRLVNNALDVATEDGGSQLRKVAAVRGLASNELRARIWPVLLGISADNFDAQEYATLTSSTHRDSSVVDVDVARSLWPYTHGWSDEARQVKRDQLHRILTAAVCSSDHVYYYQGLHDIASVLLFVLGEHLAFLCLRRLVEVQLRDCTRPTMEPVLEQLSLLHAVLRECDDPLYRVLKSTDLPPVYVLPWLITWFAHTGVSLHHMGRMFDLFLASHPLMPLYASAVVMRASRSKVMALTDPHEIHSTLMKLHILDDISVDELAQQSVTLFKTAPPQQLIRKYRLRIYSAVVHRASLEDGTWMVPEPPAAKPGKRLDDLMQLLWGPKQQDLRAGLLKLAPGIFGLPSLSVITLSLLVLFVAHTELFQRWQY